MLAELRVSDLGVIRQLSLLLGPGMTALTGETGAGKTLLVEAIELLTGGRADPTMVRPGATEAVVEGRFVVDGEEHVLCRVVPAEGRSRAYVDGRMAPMSALAELTEPWVDLHGQHAHQSLLRTAGQRAALDAFAGVDLGPLRAARAELADLDRRRAELGGDPRERAREGELLAYQLADIEAANIADLDEEEALATEESVLASATEARAAAAAAVELVLGEEGASDRLRSAIGVIGSLPGLDQASARLRGVAAEADDIGSELRGLAETIADDPERLEQVRGRRQLLRDLRRKYGETLAEVVGYADTCRTRLAELEGHGEAAERIEARRAEVEEELGKAQQVVGEARRRAAPELARLAGGHLRDLALPSARLEVEVGDDDPGDAVTFLFAANRGMPPAPLSKVASGGELARVMLAARLVLAGGPPVAVFDEVDAGVGGEAAVAVGRALATLATDRQVLVVTHLPQVAAFADHQVAVAKVESDASVETTVAVLDGPARVAELSRMLAGDLGTDASHRNAEELLSAAARQRGR